MENYEKIMENKLFLSRIVKVTLYVTALKCLGEI